MSKSVLITGARGTLGRTLEETFGSADWQVVTANRANPKEEAASRELELDLTDDAQIEAANRAFFSLTRPGDHVSLVANASNRDALATDWDTLSRETLHALFDVDVAGHFLLARAFAEQASDRGCTAAILFVGSIYGSGGVHTSIYPEGMRPTPLQYSIVKAAMTGLARDFAGRVGERGITVNCLMPGGIAGGQPEPFVRAFSALTQLGRMAEGPEVAAVAEMLCRKECAYVTGQVIHVDGGWSAW